MTPHQGKTFLLCSSQQFPSLNLGNLEGVRWAYVAPLKALNLDSLFPKKLLPLQLQRCKHIVRCGALGADDTGHCQEQLTQSLIVLKTHLLFLTQNFGGARPLTHRNIFAVRVCRHPSLCIGFSPPYGGRLLHGGSTMAPVLCLLSSDGPPRTHTPGIINPKVVRIQLHPMAYFV